MRVDYANIDHNYCFPSGISHEIGDNLPEDAAFLHEFLSTKPTVGMITLKLVTILAYQPEITPNFTLRSPITHHLEEENVKIFDVSEHYPWDARKPINFSKKCNFN